MTVDATLHIGASAISSAVRSSLTLEELIRKCFQNAEANWMATGDDALFQSSLGAALLMTDEEGRAKIQESLEPIKALNSVTSGVPVAGEHWERLADKMEAGEIMPLLVWFREERGKKA